MPDNLPPITDKHLAFALLLAKGESQTDAYTEVYGEKAGAYSLSSRLASKDNVKEWTDHLRQQVLESSTYTLTQHIRELEELKTLSVKSGNMGAAVNATVNKGKATGLYVEKREDVSKSLSITDLLNSIETHDPSTAASLKAMLGLNEPTRDTDEDNTPVSH